MFAKPCVTSDFHGLCNANKQVGNAKKHGCTNFAQRCREINQRCDVKIQVCNVFVWSSIGISQIILHYFKLFHTVYTLKKVVSQYQDKSSDPVSAK